MSTIFDRKRPHPELIARSLEPSVNRPFWLEDVGEVPQHDTLLGRHDADLAVVGGGYTGLWTAIEAKLRDPNRSVTLVEAKTLGWAASGRNGGFCEASITHGEPNGMSRWPDEYPLLHKLGMRNLDEIAAFVSERQLDCEFERTGTLTVATERYQADELLAEADGLDSVAVRAQVNSPTYLAGQWAKDETALVHPAKLVRELARVAVDLGIEIFENSPVRGLSSSAGSIELSGTGGTIRADRVVLATNAFPSLLRRYRFHTVPVFDYVLMTEPLSEHQLASIGWRNRQGISDMSNQFHYYRLSSDNRILWGGYDAIYNYGRSLDAGHYDRRQSFETLASHFFTTFPQLEGLRFTHRWGGVIDTSTRFSAFVGMASGNRVAYAAGFTGLGVGASRFVGNVMLDKLDGLQTERSSVRMMNEIPLPFPPEPAAWVGIQLTRKSLDRADRHEGKRNLLLKTLDALGMGFDS